MNTIIEKIRAEVERRMNGNPHYVTYKELESFLSFLSALEKECEEKPTTAEGLDVTDFCKPIDPGIAQCVADHFWEMLGEDEKPSDGLEEEIERYLHSLGVGYGGWVDGMEDDDLRGIARHFAQWGAEHLAGVRKMIEPEKKEGRTDCSSQGEVPNDSLATQSYENIPKDLEEAANNYLDGVYGKMPHSDYHTAIFIAGAKWQAEQDKETIELAEEHAYLAGAVNEREKMMKEAVEANVVGFDIENKTIFLTKTPTGLNLKDTIRIIILPKED